MAIFRIQKETYSKSHTHSHCYYNAFRLYITVLLLSLTVTIHAQPALSPSAYGWNDAQTDIDRYKILYRLQTDAIKLGVTVDYSEIDTANIELGYGSLLIPLADINDFKGMVINVNNTERKDYIFQRVETIRSISLTKKQIDSGDFTNIEELNNGDYMLCVKDKNVWGTRNGYADSIIRKDMIYVRNGYAKNKTIMPYDNDWTDIECTYTPVRDKPVIIKNLTVNRVAGAKYCTFIISIKNINDVRIENVTINTPDAGNFSGDQAIRFYDCMNVTLKDVTINGTYSQKDKWGYGIHMSNVYGFTAKRLKGHGTWGVFGNMNINNATLEDCDINRWDIHHYGRDVTLRHCTISNLYNQYSSIFGTVTYDCCTFNNCIPHLIDSSYNTYTKYNVVFRNCTINAMDMNARMFAFYNRNDNNINPRPELSEKYWPNVHIENLKINYNGSNLKTFVKEKSYFNNKNISNTLYDMLKM